MTINTFHGDHRPSLWRWRAQAGRFHVEGQVWSHPKAAKTNEQAAVVEKLAGSKLRSIL